MKFCEECGSFIQGDACRICKGGSFNVKIQFNEKTEDVIPYTPSSAKSTTIEKICPKCNHNEASVLNFQSRGGDEGETYIITCLACNFKYRFS